MKRATMLIHADRAPEFVEVDKAPVLYPDKMPVTENGADFVVYEQLGRVEVPVDEDETTPSSSLRFRVAADGRGGTADPRLPVS